MSIYGYRRRKCYPSIAVGVPHCRTRKQMENYGIKNVKILENDALLGYNNKIGILIRKTKINDI